MKIDWVQKDYCIYGYCSVSGRQAVFLRTNDLSGKDRVWVEEADIRKEVLADAVFRDVASAKIHCEKALFDITYSFA